MKKFYSFLAAITVLCATAFAVAPRIAGSVKAPQRAPLTAEQKSRIAAKPRAFITGSADNTKQLYGILDNESYGAFEGWSGVMAIDNESNHEKIFELADDPQTGCYFIRDGKGYLITVSWGNEIKYRIYDTETWEVSGGWQFTKNSPGVMPLDLAYDPETRYVYGYFINDTGYNNCREGKLGYIDVNNLNVLDAIKYVKEDNIGMAMRGMSFDSKGQLWGIGFDNMLYKINKFTQELTPVTELQWPARPSGADPTNMSGFINGHESAEFDWDTDELYFSGWDDFWDTYIAKIDVATGAVSYVADFAYDYGTSTDENFHAIFFMQSAATSSGTPAAVGNLTVAPVGTELKAKVEFDLPELDTENNPITGNVDWTVSDGQNVFGNGSGAAGDHVVTEVEVAAEGVTNFVVTPAIGSTNGASASAQVFVGNDTPVIWGVPDVFPDGNEATIVWKEAYSANQGNLAPVTYRVVRHPGDVVVAEATSELSAVDRLDNDIKTLCTYEVTPVSGTKTGETVTSRSAYLGTVFDYPHINKFEDALLFNEYPVIDADLDGNTWWVDTKRGAAVYSSTGNVADDYLCVGPFDMEAGSRYIFNITADTQTTLEDFEVYVGTDTEDASSFTEEIIPVTTCNPTLGRTVKEGIFAPTVSGRYYFGIHACSEQSRSNLYVYSIKVSGISASMPAAPAMTCKPTATGAVLIYALPDKNLGGTGAANVTSARIYRDNELIGEVTDGVADGATLFYEDNPTPLPKGTHTYTVTAVNAIGEGQPVTKTVYLGLDQPGAPNDIQVWEDLNTPGLMHVTWKAPQVGAKGGYIDPSTVSYTVDWGGLGSSISGETNVGTKLSFDLQISEEHLSKQGLVSFTVTALNTNGSAGILSRETKSAYYGPALSLPLRESWAEAKEHSGIWAGDAIVEHSGLFESMWDCQSGSSQDADGYMMALTTSVPDGGYRVRSPRFTLENTKSPVLIFYLSYTSSLKDFTLEVAADDQPMTPLKKFDIKPEGASWHRIEIPLDQFKANKYIQLGFTGRANEPATCFVAIDNVNIIDKVDHDLYAVSFAGPAKVMVNEPAEFNLVIRNTGFAAVKGGDYTVKLLKNGVEVTSMPGFDIEAFEDFPVSFTDYPVPTDPEQSVYTAVIDYPDDQNPNDNTSAEVPVRIAISNYPVPTSLKAEATNGVTLSWDAPDMNLIAGEPFTETFDTYESFITSGIGEWTTVDRDGCPTVIMSTMLGVLNYPHIGEPMAWQVMDPYAANIIAGAWYARSGEQMLVSFQACLDNKRDVSSDDWLISPELNGSQQTISFYARAGQGSSYAPELVDIYVSSTGTEIDDFTPLATDVEVPYASDWIEYYYTVPEGTKHFAIVHKSFNKLALLVDDITYIPAGSRPMDITLVGYHVYRDGKRITADPVDATTYVDSDVEAGKDYTYHVTAVWDNGESALSNAATVTASSSIAGVAASDEAVSVSVEGRVIRIKGAEGLPVAVYTTAGQAIAITTGTPLTEIGVAAGGVYIVRAGQTVCKLIVR